MQCPQFIILEENSSKTARHFQCCQLCWRHKSCKNQKKSCTWTSLQIPSLQDSWDDLQNTRFPRSSQNIHYNTVAKKHKHWTRTKTRNNVLGIPLLFKLVSQLTTFTRTQNRDTVTLAKCCALSSCLMFCFHVEACLGFRVLWVISRGWQLAASLDFRILWLFCLISFG